MVEKCYRSNAAENRAIIRRIVYNRIKILSKMNTLSMGKRACIYDDNFRAQILFSQLNRLIRHILLCRVDAPCAGNAGCAAFWPYRFKIAARCRCNVLYDAVGTVN